MIIHSERRAWDGIITRSMVGKGDRAARWLMVVMMMMEEGMCIGISEKKGWWTRVVFYCVDIVPIPFRLSECSVLWHSEYHSHPLRRRPVPSISPFVLPFVRLLGPRPVLISSTPHPVTSNYDLTSFTSTLRE